MEHLVSQVKQLLIHVRCLSGATESGSLVNERSAPLPQDGVNYEGDAWRAVNNRFVCLKRNVQSSSKRRDTNAGLQPRRKAPSVVLSRASSETSLLESTTNVVKYNE